MSDQLTSQSRSTESGITRRTALRGAAWSASAVTIVVATPNIAAASVIVPPPPPPTGSAKGSVTRSNGSGAVFTFDTKLTNTGSTAFTNPTVVMSWNGESRTFSLGSTTQGTDPIRLPKAGESASFSNNSQGGTVTMAFYADASMKVLLTTLSFPNMNKGTTVTVN